MAEAERRDRMERREFLRRAGQAGAIAWSAPILQTIAAPAAHAQTPVGCWHSEDPEEGKFRGCIETCKAACEGKEDFEGKACTDGRCQHDICGPGCDLPENPCPDTYCDSTCYFCNTAVPRCRVEFTCG
jgi:hypothetical protein